jgi:branched-chain amino acid transport system permease protein
MVPAHLATLTRFRTTMSGSVGSWLLAVLAILIIGVALGPRVASAGPTFFVQILTYGFSDGAIYALVAIGYTMVYGIIELINFAHGDVFTLGAAVSIPILGAFGLAEGNSLGLLSVLALLAVFAITMVLIGALNVAIERIAYRPLRNAPRLAPLITAVGVSFILEGIMALWIGNSTVHYPDILPSTRYSLGGGASVGFKDIFVVVVAVILVAALTAFIGRTTLGTAMRATAQDKEAAQLMGIDINRTIAATFFIGAALAGAGGIIFGLYYNNINFQLGFSAGLFAFTAAVFGGIGNIQGAALGGLIIGLVRAFSDGYLRSEWTDVWIFAILILVLVFRPTGLLGMRVPEK